MGERLRLSVRLLLGGLLATALGACDDIEPRAGIWFIDNDEIVEDTCRVDQVRPTAGEFRVYRAEDGDLVIDPDDGTDTFKCTTSGDAFNCPERLSQTIAADPLDAEVDVLVSVDGAFDSETAATGVRDLRLSCAGDDCDALAGSFGTSLPCHMRLSFGADWLRDDS